MPCTCAQALLQAAVDDSLDTKRRNLSLCPVWSASVTFDLGHSGVCRGWDDPPLLEEGDRGDLER